MNDESYIVWHSMSDAALSKTIGEFIKYHRVNQNKTQDEVSRAANISRSTLSLLERGETVTISTLLQVLRVLDLLYVMDVFKVSHEISPIEYAKLTKNKRQRASSKKEGTDLNDNIGW
jgi:transcriptional regulator with XRE-family HTH domain